MTKAHDAVVTGQFGPRADAYVESAVHARGEDLAALETVMSAGPGPAAPSIWAAAAGMSRI